MFRAGVICRGSGSGAFVGLLTPSERQMKKKPCVIPVFFAQKFSTVQVIFSIFHFNKLMALMVRTFHNGLGISYMCKSCLQRLKALCAIRRVTMRVIWRQRWDLTISSVHVYSATRMFRIAFMFWLVFC